MNITKALEAFLFCIAIVVILSKPKIYHVILCSNFMKNLDAFYAENFNCIFHSKNYLF